MKRCARCRQLKPVDEFGYKTTGLPTRVSYCRPCVRARSKEHYEANKSSYLSRNQRKKAKLQKERFGFLMDYFQAHPCADCGETDPVVLDFDHLRDKEFSIGNQLIIRSWAQILAEIEKCDVVCANCHRRRTAIRAGYLRARLAAQR